MAVSMFRSITILITLIYNLACNTNLHADEEGTHVFEYCNKDPRFKEHLLHRVDFDAEKNRLRKSQFRRLAMLISLVKFHEIEVFIQEGKKKPANNTFSLIVKSANPKNTDFPLQWIINVNPNGDFASAYYSVVRELILSRIILEKIENGEIKESSRYEDFLKIYADVNKKTIDMIAESFDKLDADWCKSEGIEADSRTWKKREISQISTKGEKLSEEIQTRAKILFDSYNSVFPR